MGLILLVILIACLLGSGSGYYIGGPHWGIGGGFGLLVIVILILLLMGRI